MAGWEDNSVHCLQFSIAMKMISLPRPVGVVLSVLVHGHGHRRAVQCFENNVGKQAWTCHRTVFSGMSILLLCTVSAHKLVTQYNSCLGLAYNMNYY